MNLFYPFNYASHSYLFIFMTLLLSLWLTYFLKDLISIFTTIENNDCRLLAKKRTYLPDVGLHTNIAVVATKLALRQTLFHYLVVCHGLYAYTVINKPCFKLSESKAACINAGVLVKISSKFKKDAWGWSFPKQINVDTTDRNHSSLLVLLYIMICLFSLNFTFPKQKNRPYLRLSDDIFS